MIRTLTRPYLKGCTYWKFVEVVEAMRMNHQEIDFQNSDLPGEIKSAMARHKLWFQKHTFLILF